MEILCISLQFIREQMEISVISCQMRLFFTISLQFIREQMEIWLKMLALKTKMGSHLFASVLYLESTSCSNPGLLIFIKTANTDSYKHYANSAHNV